MRRREFARPVVWVSACLGFQANRYNGQMLPADFLGVLAPHVEYRQVCPEVAIGLGVPRHPIRLVQNETGLRLQQYETQADVTERMQSFIADWIARVDLADGFVLKSRSPSCGFKDVRVYPSLGPVQAVSSKGNGFFGGAVLDAFPDLPLEDEGRLQNYTIREHFLTRIFTTAAWRAVETGVRMKELVAFHAAHKYLLLLHNEVELRRLGKIVANHERRGAEEVFALYGRHLRAALAKAPRPSAAINVLSHILGHVSDQLTPPERAFALDTFEMYREERVPLSVPLNLLRGFAIRFANRYLLDQAVFEPFPLELVLISDSGKGRDSKR
jgi:uncharacterized protein YbgA (DUF1722 family)/uncharacterized protein YbbK (DUF523 family)